MVKHIQTAIQCPICGTVSYIFRKAGKQKKAGHLKKMYCFKCKRDINQVEIKDPAEFYVVKETDLTPINKKRDRIRIEQQEDNFIE